MIVTPLSNEAVRLNWNRIHTPPLPSTLPNFTVAKELSTGVFTNFRTLPDTTTTDTNFFCNKFINYRVTQGDLSGCQSVSSIDGELFRDTKGPAQTLLDTVSIDPFTGDVTISWFPDSSNDTQGYVIYEFNGVSYDSIGAVSGINSLTFTNTLSNANSQVETYTVAAFDSCKNLSAPAANHNTIFLSKSFVKCTATLSLNWNAYMNMKNGVARYEIWYSENGGTWTLESFVPAGVLTKDVVLTTQNATYEFFIKVIGNNGQSSRSNIVSQVADIFTQPDFLYIRSLNVAGSSVSVTCHVDPAGDVSSYRLYRGSTALGPFSLVEEQSYTPVSTIIFNDVSANADDQQQFYKLTATDSCGLEQSESNIAGTVFLMAEGGNDLISELNWLDYLGWQSGTGSYNIYMSANGVIIGGPIAMVSGDTLFYEDDVSDLPVTDGNICYIVEAIEDSVNSFGFTDNAFSNEACAPQSATAYVPNAFTPKGKNPLFKPIIVFGDPATYSFKVFNRWGQTVFESGNPSEGWNGTFQEDDAPVGVYAYLLVFKGFNKKEIRKSGTVMLLR
jgi:hypothetical protein